MKTIAILSNKGGAGKTTLAIHLAVAAAQSKKSVAVFDLDPQGSATTWSEARDDDTPAVVPTHARHLTRMLDAPQAIVRGITAQEYQPKSKAAGEVGNLYQWIMTEVLV